MVPLGDRDGDGSPPRGRMSMCCCCAKAKDHGLLGLFQPSTCYYKQENVSYALQVAVSTRWKLCQENRELWAVRHYNTPPL